MKTLILLAALVASSCSHVVPIVEDCSASAAANFIDDVNTALATEQYADGLAKLVAKFGACVIEKAVKQVAESAGLRAQYDSLEAVKMQRARAWLDSRK